MDTLEAAQKTGSFFISAPKHQAALSAKDKEIAWLKEEIRRTQVVAKVYKDVEHQWVELEIKRVSQSSEGLHVEVIDRSES